MTAAPARIPRAGPVEGVATPVPEPTTPLAPLAAGHGGAPAPTDDPPGDDAPAARRHGDRRELGLLVVAAVGLAAGVALRLGGATGTGETALAATTVLGIAPAAWYVLEAARHRRLGADAIALAALVGALAVGERLAGAVITVMLAGGRALEAHASARAERDLRALVGRTPRTVHRLDDGTLVDVPVGDVAVGDLLLVKPGEVVAVDGRLTERAAVLDEAALTGEARPVERSPGEPVRSGVVNAGGPFELRATTTADASTYAGIVRLVRQAAATSAPFVRLADRVSGWFLVVSAVAAGGAWAVSGDPVRAVAVLVVATPCPLVLAAPIAVVAGLSRTARLGVVVKGGDVLERLAGASVLLFDKTGTLTAGQPAVVAVHTAGSAADRDVLRLAAALDQVSPHVLATAVVLAARARGLDLPLPADVVETPGKGVRGRVDGHDVWVGRLSWLGEGLDQSWARAVRRRAEREGRVTIFVRVDGAVAGVVLLEDPIRPDAARALRRLRADGFRRLVMVTGDRDDVARSVAAVVGVDDVLAERTPAEKVDAVFVERASGGGTIMVGDGLNDAAALAAADVGVALAGRGATAASEAADVVVMVDRIDRLGDAVRVARRSRRIARQSVVAGMGLSLVAMAAAAVGALPPAAGALAQEGIDLAVILNALRALGTGRRGGPDLAGRDRDLTLRFRDEHRALWPEVDRLLAVADRVGVDPPERWRAAAREAHRFLVEELLPHEQAEDTELYPALARVFGGHDPTGTMSRGHAEIAHLTHRLGRLLDDLDESAGPATADGPTADPQPTTPTLAGAATAPATAGDDEADAADARRLLYGLHAVLRLHFSQEDEGYLSLADDAPTGSGGAGASAAAGRRTDAA